jgi:hypothetical protein
MTAKHRAAVEALKAWAIEANQNDPEGLALACQALDAAFGDHEPKPKRSLPCWSRPHGGLRINWRRIASATGRRATTEPDSPAMSDATPAARGDLRKNPSERAEKPRTKAESRAFAILCMHDI